MMSETHPQFTSKYTKLSDSDVEASSPVHKRALVSQGSIPQQVQMSSLHHTDYKHSSRQAQTPKAANSGIPHHSVSLQVEESEAAARQRHADSSAQSDRKAINFTSAQSATQESQLQLSVSTSESSSSGILAVRSASMPLETHQRTDPEREPEAQRTPRHAQRAPSLELVLPDAGMDSDMGAIQASLQAAAEKVSWQAQYYQTPSPTIQISPEDLSPQHSSTNLDTVSEADSATEKLLPDTGQRSTQDSSDGDHVVDIHQLEDPAKPWYKQSIVTVCLAGGGLITLFMNYLDELAPIFASAKPSAGGLGMPEHQFAWPLTFGGLVLMLYSLLLYPRNQKRWGHRKCCKMGLLLTIPSSLILPFAHTFVQMQWATQACMFVGIGVRSIAKIMALSSSTIIINTVAPMKQIGSVNGASQTLNALARAIGPFIAGIVWGLCADSAIPGKQYVPFLGSIVGVVATDVLYMYIVLPS